MKTLPLLVTGAAGFVGARFVGSAQARGVPVISVDERSYFDGRPEHAGIDLGTVVDRRDLFDWLAHARPALAGIVHLGARTDTTESDEALLTALNVEYSQKLWRHAAATGVPFVYASSAATYGDGAWGYDDDEARIASLVPLNAYGRSKQTFDLWALAQTDTPPAWSGWKFFNVYGYGERHKGRMASVVLHAYDQLQAGDPIQLFRSHRAGIADGHQARDFIDVRDIIDVLWFALHRPVARGIYNLGTGQARTFLDLARAVCQTLGVDERIEFTDTPVAIRERYQYFTEARTARLRALGYTTPFTSLESGVADYIATLCHHPSARATASAVGANVAP